MKKEYVYILSNPITPGILKIGRTIRDPKVRLKEINSATGVIQPFKIEVIIETENSRITEKNIHLRLASKRVNKQREFFKISVKEATKVAKEYSKKSNNRITSDTNNKLKYISIFPVLACFIWIGVYNNLLSLLFLTITIWVYLTKYPKIINEVLIGSSIIGKTGALFCIIISLIPLITGQFKYEKYNIKQYKYELSRLFMNKK